MENSKQRIRFVCVSDTHGLTAKLEVPPGDVLIHAGDFTNYGEPKIIEEFNDWLGSLPHPVKIVIAGNHERTFDTKNLPEIYKHLLKLKGLQFDPLKIKGLLTNCTYLEDSSVNIYGYKIYGSPWGFYRKDCAFHVETPEELAKIWSNIPSDTDILVTHQPPYGTLDLMYPNKHVGEKLLMKAVRERVKPLIHIFGHIHESYGITQKAGIHCINASTCTIDYVPSNRPIVFDLPNKSVSEH